MMSLFVRWGAAEAPFSPWVATHGPAEGAALSLVDRLRQAVPSLAPLVPPSDAPAWELTAEGWLRFRALVEAELREISGSTVDLVRLRQLFALNLTELGELFGATRQAVTKWQRDGLPAARRAKAATAVVLGELLERKLRPGRVPAVARRPAAAYGGRTMLDRIAADEHEELLEEVRASFDWAATA